jgi:hypothetical protein
MTHLRNTLLREMEQQMNVRDVLLALLRRLPVHSKHRRLPVAHERAEWRVRSRRLLAARGHALLQHLCRPLRDTLPRLS